MDTRAKEPQPANSEGKGKNRLNQRSYLQLTSGCIFLIGLVFASYMLAATGLTALKQVEAGNRRADRLDRLLMGLIDAETSVRGYVLTNNPEYLQPYRVALPVIERTAQAVREDYADQAAETVEVNKLLGLLDLTLENLDTILKETQQGDRVGIGRYAYGKSIMDVYRVQHRAMRAELATNSLGYVTESITNFEKTKIVTIALAVFGFMLLIWTVMVNQRQINLRERLAQMLHDENHKLETEVQTRTAELTQLATYLTNAREAERMHLARELHDELGALLTAAKFDVDWIERNLPNDARTQMTERLARLQGSLHGGITMSRRIINDLRPALLADLGLVEALHVMLAEHDPSGEVKMHVDLPQDAPPLSQAANLIVYRIVQEALTNIRKYAEASEIFISLKTTESQIELQIMDNGKGFDLAQPRLAKHGLSGIKHRVYTLDGRLEIQSAPGAGTSISVWLPYSANPKDDDPETA